MVIFAQRHVSVRLNSVINRPGVSRRHIMRHVSEALALATSCIASFIAKENEDWKTALGLYIFLYFDTFTLKKPIIIINDFLMLKHLSRLWIRYPQPLQRTFSQNQQTKEIYMKEVKAQWEKSLFSQTKNNHGFLWAFFWLVP